ncbi:MAG: sigma-70 family RNA polymerase sigma factor [Candidatus Eremiobacteraeota bacterium]|nr:sigma-70 family RNA polymerase sigma factor [Candidatus Eremiobacteraeota bacterium]
MTTKAAMRVEREIMPHVRPARQGVSAKPPGRSGVHGSTMGLALAVDSPLTAPVEDDQALIAATLAGRSEAFGELVSRYQRAVYHLAVRTLHDRTEAEDAAQEAFLKAYRALATFRPGAKFSTWIFTICYRACCDRLAKRKRFSGEELPDRADSAAGPELLAERSDEAERLRAAIDGLPEKYRTVITLYHLQGKQYEEIATVLNLPLGTVKTHLFRAKEQLRKALTA